MVALHHLDDMKQHCQEETQSAKRHSNSNISLTLVDLLHFRVKQNFNLDLFYKWKDMVTSMVVGDAEGSLSYWECAQE